jgi:hypothetical protein
MHAALHAVSPDGTDNSKSAERKANKANAFGIVRHPKQRMPK